MQEKERKKAEFFFGGDEGLKEKFVKRVSCVFMGAEGSETFPQRQSHSNTERERERSVLNKGGPEI